MQKTNEIQNKPIYKELYELLKNRAVNQTNIDNFKETLSQKIWQEKVLLNEQSWQFLLNENLIVKPHQMILIGFGNYEGEWSDKLKEHLIERDNVVLYPIDSKLAKNSKILGLFDAFVNPGGRANYPDITEEIYSNYIEDGQNHFDSEYAYKDIVAFAINYNKPYLGVCLGNQFLIMNQGGPIIGKILKHDFYDNRELITRAGTIVHFLSMNKYEQSEALFKGNFPEISFAINTQHGHAGIDGNTGTLGIGGLSDLGIVQAVAKNFYQVGYQFHLELYYEHEKDNLFARNKNLLLNFIKIVELSKYINIEQYSKVLEEKLDLSFQNGQCYQEDTCLKLNFVTDVLTLVGQIDDLY